MPGACPRPVTSVLTFTRTRTSTRHCPYACFAGRFPFANIWGAPRLTGCAPDVCIEDASCVGTRGGRGGRWGASCLSSSCGKRSAFDQDSTRPPLPPPRIPLSLRPLRVPFPTRLQKPGSHPGSRNRLRKVASHAILGG